jgi:acetyl esterase/lipase
MTLRALLLGCLSLYTVAGAEPRVERNVIYGMYSGLALLLDVHHPGTANGRAIIVIQGSGWNSSQAYSAQPLTNLTSSIRFFVPKLLDGGYTLFVVNHRNGPRFHYPAALEDVQRAVRYLRYHAHDYGIDPSRIGALGYSSGAHLAALLGVLDGAGDPLDPDPVNRGSARVQCVVTAALGSDLTQASNENVVSFMGQLLPHPTPIEPDPDPVALRAYHEASPISHVSSSSAPLLLLHGDADKIVPFRQAEIMESAMKTAGAEVRLIRLAGGSHGFGGEIANHPDWPDFFAETVRWFKAHL